MRLPPAPILVVALLLLLTPPLLAQGDRGVYLTAKLAESGSGDSEAATPPEVESVMELDGEPCEVLSIDEETQTATVKLLDSEEEKSVAWTELSG